MHSMPLLWLSLASLAGITLAAQSNQPAVLWLVAAGASLSTLAWRVLAFYITTHHSRLVRQLIRLTPLRLLRVLIRVRGLLARVGSPLPLGLLLFALCGGALRYQLAQPDLSDPGVVASYIDPQTVYVLEGVVSQPPDRRDLYTNLRLDVQRLRPLDNLLFTEVGGKLLARVPPEGDWRYGDRVRLRGFLETPFETDLSTTRGSGWR